MIPQIGDILQIKTKIKWLSPIIYGIVIESKKYYNSEDLWDFIIKDFNDKILEMHRYSYDNINKYCLGEDGYNSFIDIKIINLDK